MKNLILFCLLSCNLAFGQAETSTPVCDSILLVNGEVLIGNVVEDENGVIRYRECNNHFSVKEVRSVEVYEVVYSVAHGDEEQLAEIEEIDTVVKISNDPPTMFEAFKNKRNGIETINALVLRKVSSDSITEKELVFDEGTKIKVRTHDLSVHKGPLLVLNEDSIIVGSTSIAVSDIEMIKRADLRPIGFTYTFLVGSCAALAIYIFDEVGYATLALFPPPMISGILYTRKKSSKWNFSVRMVDGDDPTRIISR